MRGRFLLSALLVGVAFAAPADKTTKTRMRKPGDRWLYAMTVLIDGKPTFEGSYTVELLPTPAKDAGGRVCLEQRSITRIVVNGKSNEREASQFVSFGADGSTRLHGIKHGDKTAWIKGPTGFATIEPPYRLGAKLDAKNIEATDGSSFAYSAKVLSRAPLVIAGKKYDAYMVKVSRVEAGKPSSGTIWVDPKVGVVKVDMSQKTAKRSIRAVHVLQQAQLK